MFVEDLTYFIAENTSLTMDVDLFIGADQVDTSAKTVIVSEFAGGLETWPGHITHPVQVLAKDLTYMTAEALAYIIYDLLANKPGFSTLANVFFCDVLNRPFLIGRDPRGSFIFSANYLFKVQ